eukprot:7289096-Pyramimonas_sp.AAC.1
MLEPSEFLVRAGTCAVILPKPICIKPMPMTVVDLFVLSHVLTGIVTASPVDPTRLISPRSPASLHGWSDEQRAAPVSCTCQ